jgi:hypothetical protein
MSGLDRRLRVRVMLGHPRGVAPERVSKTDATDGSVRDRQALQCNEGIFYCGITVVSSRADISTSLRHNGLSVGAGFDVM